MVWNKMVMKKKNRKEIDFFVIYLVGNVKKNISWQAKKNIKCESI
jgi:hypothetical protein